MLCKKSHKEGGEKKGKETFSDGNKKPFTRHAEQLRSRVSVCKDTAHLEERTTQMRVP